MAGSCPATKSFPSCKGRHFLAALDEDPNSNSTMATIFDVSDVVLEEPVIGEKEREGKTDVVPVWWCTGMHTTAGSDVLHTQSRGGDVEAQNQLTLTSEGNLALFEVSFLPVPSPSHGSFILTML